MKDFYLGQKCAFRKKDGTTLVGLVAKDSLEKRVSQTKGKKEKKDYLVIKPIGNGFSEDSDLMLIPFERALMLLN